MIVLHPQDNHAPLNEVQDNTDFRSVLRHLVKREADLLLIQTYNFQSTS